VIRRLDLRSAAEVVLPRAQLDVEHALQVVGPLCDDVRERGEVAVLEYGERFDGVRPASLRVDPARITAALDGLDPAVQEGLTESIARLRATCEAHDAEGEAELERQVAEVGRASGRVRVFAPV
jgi:histidinol dehydrogenase